MADSPESPEYKMIDHNHSGVSNHTSPLSMDTSGGPTTTQGPPTSPWSFEFSVIMATILSISAFLTIVGNIMVLMVIIRHRGMRTRTNLFLVNLAVSDLLIGLVVVPFSIATLVEGNWIFGKPDGFMCSMNSWMNAFCLVTSIHTLMYIGVHKFFSIVQPLNNPLKLQHIICMMAAAWFWGALSATIAVMGLKSQYKTGTSQCGPNYPKYWRDYLYHGIIQVTVIIIPFIILVFCYVRMFREIKKHSQRLRDNSTVEEDFLITQQKKVAVTLFIVLATFVMMVLPYHIYATYTTIKADKDHFPPYMNPLAYSFVYFSSMCNPIIYAFRSPAFREGYKEILCQTPNYVISDESDAGRRNSRLPSIFSSRRTSRPSISNATSLLDSEAGLISPLPTSPSQTSNTPSWPSKNKSLVSLVRSTRQSKASSVIHRNGETIVIKGGKIVCVRRESDSVASPTRGPSRPILDMANQVADSSKTVVCGIALMATESDHTEDNGNLGMSHDDQALDTSRSKSETETSFEQMDLEMAGLDDLNAFENAESDDFPREDVAIQSGVDEIYKGKPINDEKHNQGDIPKKLEWMAPIIEVHDSDEESQPSVADTVNSSSSALSKMVLSIASNTDILTGMPLSPLTKNVLAKSDIDLSAPLAPNNRTNLGMPHARSTENLSPRRHFKRLPSVEYLDPPVRILQTQSNRRRPTAAAHHSPRLKPKSPLFKPRNLH